MSTPLTPPSSRPAFPATATHTALRTVYGGRPFHTDGSVLALRFAPDGRLYSFEDGGVLRCWDVAHGRLVRWHLLDSLGTLWGFNDSARFLAEGSDDLSLHDTASGQPVAAVPQTSWVSALAFEGDTGVIATGHDDGSVRVWDGPESRLVARLPGHPKAVSALAFSPDGKRLATAGEEKVIVIWDLEREEEVGRLVGHTDRIPALVWHPEGRRLYSAGWDTTARVWDVATGEPIILLNSHAAQVNALAISPDGDLLACADGANAVHVWQTDTHETVCVFPEHDDEIRCLAFAPDGTTLVSGGDDRVIRIWTGLKTARPQGPARFQRRDEDHVPGVALALSPDGRRLACPAGGAALRLWDVESGTLLAPLHGAGLLRAVAWSPDGRRVAGGGDATPVHLWDGNGDSLRLLEGQAGVVASLAFSADGTLLASAAAKRGDVWLWDVATGEPWLLIPDADDACSIEAVAFHPTRRLVAAAGIDHMATGGSDGAVSIWDVDARREVALLDGGGTGLAFHPAGRLLAVAGLGPSVSVWDFEAGTLLHELAGHEDAVTAVAYSPDGRWLASVAGDRTVRLWDASTGAASGGIELDTQALALAFAPDGSCLFTANANTSCYRLDVARLLAC